MIRANALSPVLTAVMLASFTVVSTIWPSEARAYLPWKTDQWQVACEDSIKNVIARPDDAVADIAETRLSELIDSHDFVNRHFDGDRAEALVYLENVWRRIFEDAGDLCDPSRSDLLGRIDEQLEWASRWLEAMGFSGPDLATAQSAIEGPLFPETLIDCLSNYCASLNIIDLHTHGTYSPSRKTLRIGIWVANAMVPADEFRPTDKLDSGNVDFAYTPTHELFHAIQFAYDGVPRDWLQQGWIIEGTASYVDIVAGRLRGTLTQPDWPHRLYDQPLHIPNDPQDPGHGWKYGSWYFWDFLGSRFEEGDGVAYLESIFRHDLSRENGLEGVHSALGMEHPTGLYDLFPAFVQERLDGDDFFEAVSEHRVQVDGRELIMGQRVDPMAANAHRVEYELSGAPAAGLSVRLSEDHPDLHLVVDRERADKTDGDGSDRNVWRTRVAESGEIFVRVVNTAPYPPDSEPRDYDLEVRLVPLDPCSQQSMVSVVNEARTFLGPFRAEERNAHPLIPERARQFVERQTKKLEPGTGRLSVSGVFSDAGVGCSGHVGATSLTGRLMTGDQQATEEYVERLEEMAERMEGFVEKTEGADDLSSEERNAIAEEARSMQDAFSADADGREQTVVFSVYSPNAWVWQAGLLSDPTYVKHSGVGGWRDNAAAHFVLHLVGATPDDIREGETYEAVALGVPMGRVGETPSVPTPAGFYTRWSGEFSRVSYPPPANADQARRQQRAKADCRHGKRAFTGMRQRMGVGQLLTGEAMERRDCEYMDTAFAGRIDRVFGNLRGSVTIDEMTGAEIRGRFELSGSATVESSKFTHEYDGEGRLIGDREERSTRSGDLRIEGELRAPNQAHGQARFGWEAIVID